MAIRFEVLARSRSCGARVGRVETGHGGFDTPAFMPVGTAGSVKGLLPGMVRELGSQIVLANTYHLMLRPGAELVGEMGGLQKWTGWEGPMLTDSGGYQVFSLAQISKIDKEGVTFRSHIDGAMVGLTARKSIQIQNQLGADIIMAFDDCPPAPGSPGTPGTPGTPGSSPSEPPEPPEAPEAPEAPEEIALGLGNSGEGSPGSSLRRSEAVEGVTKVRVREANERTVRWLEECIGAHGRKEEQALFGIVQGGVDLEERRWCAERVVQHDLPGYAIGGLAVGEGFEAFKAVAEYTAGLLPGDRPRYLMGVGYERDLLAGVRAGVDMFDCVLPTRNGRNASAFTPVGGVKLRNAKWSRDERVLDEGCDCPACGRGGGFSRSYLKHLFLAGEMLGPVLVSAHNIRHFQRFMADLRGVVVSEDWSGLGDRWPVVKGEVGG